MATQVALYFEIASHPRVRTAHTGRQRKHSTSKMHDTLRMTYQARPSQNLERFTVPGQEAPDEARASSEKRSPGHGRMFP